MELLLPYSLLLSKAFLGLFQQNLAARLCPHATEKRESRRKVSCSCSSHYADRAGEGSRFHTMAGLGCPSQCSEGAWRSFLMSLLKWGALTHNSAGDGNVDDPCGSLPAQIILCSLLWCCNYSYQAAESSCGPSGSPGTGNAVSANIIASLTEPCSSSGLSQLPLSTACEYFLIFILVLCMKVLVENENTRRLKNQGDSFPGWSFLSMRSKWHNSITTWSTLMLPELFSGGICFFQ